ncbi:MAG: cyclomaltodextrin glucanotransferase [Gammaproteobacteria bacterium]|nr:MAG: cyclomaltodextrin glucanotransferase [Gammaproteobacteria bacterium]
MTILFNASAGLFIALTLTGCAKVVENANESQVVNSQANELPAQTFVGTHNNYASQAIYFLMTDRFVDGDSSNNHDDQGGDFPTFNIQLTGKNGKKANVGYLGGDFQGVLNNAQYIKDMGFTSVWLTPIFDNPDQAFSGGQPITYGGAFKDGGKTGYHGYWGVNFYQVDEHYDSPSLSFKDFTTKLQQDYQLEFVLDIVGNHGSPAYSMPVDQPKFGELYDQNNKLVADHQNLHPEKLFNDLSNGNALHQFYNNKPDIAELSDLNENNPEVLTYFTNAYLQWLEQGADSIRIDTIKHMPHHFWKKLTDNIRAVHPDIFIFAESFSYDADFIAEHTRAENGGVSVLDFPGQKAITSVFEHENSDYSDILSYLHLTDGTYHNPYELMTFYDNHDMARMNASDEGFIDANNWLFTARGIPVIYYGSEINFMTGKREHEGNRNYLGQANIEKAKGHMIHKALTDIANVRKNAIALQKGIQLNLNFNGNTASFYRVYQVDGVNQTALVLLNKSHEIQDVKVALLNAGVWQDAVSKESISVSPEQNALILVVPAHGVRVLLFNEVLTSAKLIERLMLESYK